MAGFFLAGELTPGRRDVGDSPGWSDAGRSRGENACSSAPARDGTAAGGRPAASSPAAVLLSGGVIRAIRSSAQPGAGGATSPAPQESDRDQHQSNSELTLVSSLMRRIASAIRGATVIWRMFWASFTASVAKIESVIVIISIGEEAMRATAPPESTP